MKCPAYPKYKTSEVEWLGEMPEGWVVTKTARYFKIGMGQTILKENLLDDGRWPVFSATDGDHYFGRIDDVFVKLKPGDIVIPARGNSIGSVKIVEEPATTTQTTIYCSHISIEKLLPRFIFYYLRGCKKHLFPFTQTAIPQITVEEVGANPLLVPSFSEQTTIAPFLDHKTAQIDALIAKKQRFIELLQEKRSALISHAVTKGLDPTIKMKPSGVEWLGEVPEGWVVEPLRYNVKLLTKKTNEAGNPVALENIESWTGRLILTETEFEGEGVAFNAGDILFGKLRPYLAKVYLADSYGEAVGDFHVMRPGTEVYGRFIQYQILSRGFIDKVDGSTFGSKMPRASWEFVGGMKIIIPPLSEQNAIATFLDRETAKLDRLIEKVEAAMERLREYRTALISAAVTGKIDVRGWDCEKAKNLTHTREPACVSADR